MKAAADIADLVHLTKRARDILHAMGNKTEASFLHSELKQLGYAEDGENDN